MLSACQQESAPANPKKRSKTPLLVETATLVYKEFGQRALRTGTLQAERAVKIFNQEEGRITAIAAHVSDQVAKDDVLVRLDASLLEAQLGKTLATRKQAEQDLKRLRTLVRKRLAPEDEQARAQTALKVAQAEEALLRTRLNYTTIRAPFAGVITERRLEPGDIAPRYSHVLSLIDPGSLITRVSISELLLARLKPGDAVQVQIDALGASAVTGKIQRIYPTIDPTTRQGVVEIALQPVPEGARAGQLCRVRLNTPPQRRLTAPFSALQRDTKGQYLFVVDAEHKVRQRYVQTGLQQDQQIEIIDGASEGERVIVRGFIGLKDGSEVQIAEPAMQSAQ